MYSNEDGSGIASLTKRNLEHFGTSMDIEEEVEVLRLDTILNFRNLGTICYLKLDIEGHELYALQGLGERIYDVQLIQFEFGGCNIDTRTFFRDFWYFFLSVNFKIFRITPLGPSEIKTYKESSEYFSTTNYIAVN